MNKVNIVVVNYTRYLDTIECIESILKSNYRYFQIFIVDNSPSNESLDKIAEWLTGNSKIEISTIYNSLVLPFEEKPISFNILDDIDFLKTNAILNDRVTIVSTENNGFASANNLVINYLLTNSDDNDFLWILNNDTVIDKNAMSSFVEIGLRYLNKNYMYGAKLINYHQPNVLQAVAGRFNKFTGYTTHVGEGEIDYGQYNSFQFNKDDYIVGASIFLQIKVLKIVGIISEEYFLYFEDLDWSNVAKNKGINLVFQSMAKVYHKEGGTNKKLKEGKRGSSMAGFYTLVNRVKFTKKWYKNYILFTLPGIAYGLIKRLLQGKSRLVFKAIRAIFNTDKLIKY